MAEQFIIDLAARIRESRNRIIWEAFTKSILSAIDATRKGLEIYDASPGHAKIPEDKPEEIKGCACPERNKAGSGCSLSGVNKESQELPSLINKMVGRFLDGQIVTSLRMDGRRVHVESFIELDPPVGDLVPGVLESLCPDSNVPSRSDDIEA